jgi:hypothetical protein
MGERVKGGQRTSRGREESEDGETRQVRIKQESD